VNFISVENYEIKIIALKTLIAENKKIFPGKAKIQIHHIWQRIQWLSIDVALGAMCSSAMACTLMRIQPLPWLAISILGAMVFLIYTTDHMCDLQHMPVESMSNRRLFHWKHKRPLQIFAGILAGLVALLCLLYLPLPLIYFGIALGSLVALYLLLVNYLQPGQGNKWFHKEICVAVVYTSGVWGVGFVQAKHITAIHWLLVFAFGLIVLQNLLLFSCFELDEDVQQHQRSLAKTWGKELTKKILLVTFLLFAAVMLLGFFFNTEELIQQALSIFCIMAAILGLLFCFPNTFRKNDWYRLIGDGIFFIPGFVLLNELLFT